jgi:hypothetical protein
MYPLFVLKNKRMKRCRNIYSDGTQFLLVPNGMGAKNDDMVKIFELLINVVIFNKRKATELRKH